ncbi:hypothetical protein QA612_09760 [Evansella sp. AB-P1]|uniref:hypothetical protein n=1 Tax=Evansella sp. AB-P1 TaxID=3037653 RepID=UPI00241D0485|nr:hypothetical protein [Evansella sp. AB-P1]MDG5787785.1 hypothetical protein [Evansella sp. AB-P1]
MADFTIKYDLDEDGNYTIPYISFESEEWDTWRNTGGYIIYYFTDYPKNEFDSVQFKIEGTTNRIYPHYNGQHGIRVYWGDGRQLGDYDSWVIENVCEYDEDYLEGYRGSEPYEGNPFTNPNANCSAPQDPGNGGGDDDDPPSDGGGDARWNDLMDKLEEISDNIPSPPNWEEVADTIRDSIVPGMIDDLESMFGTAPPPPAAPGSIELPSENVNDYASDLDEQTPSLEEVPGLDDSGYSLDDIASEAPEIEFREDPTGGFEIGNPIDMLPDFPTNPPMPGEDSDDYGEWNHQPDTPILETPDSNGTIETPTNPIPGESNGGDNIPTPSNGDGTGGSPTPPMPGGGDNSSPPTPGGDGGSSLPMPGDGGSTPPSGGDEPGENGLIDYKPNPGSEDGSGGRLGGG